MGHVSPIHVVEWDVSLFWALKRFTQKINNMLMWRGLPMKLCHVGWKKCPQQSSAIFQKIQFSRILIDRVWFLINRKFPKFSSLASAWLDWYLIDAQSIKTEIFLVFKYLTKFLHASFEFTCITFFFFLYPSYCFAVISLIVFTHNIHLLC